MSPGEVEYRIGAFEDEMSDAQHRAYREKVLELAMLFAVGDNRIPVVTVEEAKP